MGAVGLPRSGFNLDMLILPVVKEILMGKITEVLWGCFGVIRDFTQKRRAI
jgi:hypothetical protein